MKNEGYESKFFKCLRCEQNWYLKDIKQDEKSNNIKEDGEIPFYCKKHLY